MKGADSSHCRVIRRRQAGLTTVELALVGLLAFIILFGAIEFARLMYTWNALTEGTRRGARVAAVCPPNHAAIANVTLLRSGDGSSVPIAFPDLTTDNVQIEYLTAAGTTASPLTAAELVRVSIIDYQLTLFIPGFPVSVNMPPFQTTLPAESLGIIPGGTPNCVFP